MVDIYKNGEFDRNQDRARMNLISLIASDKFEIHDWAISNGGGELSLSATLRRKPAAADPREAEIERLRQKNIDAAKEVMFLKDQCKRMDEVVKKINGLLGD